MTPHPATVERAKVEADLKARMEQWVEAKVMYRTGALTKEALVRTEGFVEQALQNFRDACYAELDDGHGLGKGGLDAAREVVLDAVWIKSPDAWLVSDDVMRNLANAIGMKDEL